jgi:AraC-like DNA-binding protein
MNDPAYIQMNNLRYCSAVRKQHEKEQFIPEHMLNFIIAGDSYLQTQQGQLTLNSGSITLLCRNQLIKTVNIPAAIDGFQSVSILLDQSFLRDYRLKAQIPGMKPYTGDPVMLLPSDELLRGYFESVLPYLKLNKPLIPAIADLKTQEAVALLLNLNPDLAEILFDFREPEKVDLETFMNENFIYNVHTAQFARLTGRSLATFKRDFQKVFKLPPGQWLLHKRLKEAHYQIKEKGRKPLDVYLNVGFENLSHFSFAFKSAFGVLPSKL